MTPGAAHASREEARATKAQVAAELAGLAGVAGIGLAKQPDGGWSVRVNVTTQEVSQAVGARLQSAAPAVPVQVRVTGTIRASG